MREGNNIEAIKQESNIESSDINNEERPEKLPCRYCGQMVRQERLLEHEEFRCGGREGPCKCGVGVSPMNRKKHLKSCIAYKELMDTKTREYKERLASSRQMIKKTDKKPEYELTKTGKLRRRGMPKSTSVRTISGGLPSLGKRR